MSIEAMKHVLDAMGLMGADLICEAAHHEKKDRHEIGETCPIQQRWHKAFAALRTAIEQAEKQEPVATYTCDVCGVSMRMEAALPETQPAPMQVSPTDFVDMVMDKEGAIGKPILWAEWPNREKNTC